MSFANRGLPYHIGGEIPARDALAVQTPESLKGLLNLDVRTRREAIRIDRASKGWKSAPVTGECEWLDYDS